MARSKKDKKARVEAEQPQEGVSSGIKPTKATSRGKRLDIAVRSICGNIVFAKDSAWAFYKVANNPFELLSNDERVARAAQTIQAYTNSISDKSEPVDFININTTEPIDLVAWERSILENTRGLRRPLGFDNFLDKQLDYLYDQNFLSKVSYVGVCLGKRNALDFSTMNVFEYGFKGALESFTKWSQKALSLPAEEVSRDEEERFRKLEEPYYTSLSTSALSAERMTAKDILLVIKRMFYPAMGTQYLDVDHGERIGPGDLDLECYSVIRNKYRWLEFEQALGDDVYTGYRCTLSLSRFQPETIYPQVYPYFYLPRSLGLPFTTYSRFSLMPVEKMKKELEKKRAEAKDELKNITAGQDAYDSAVAGGLPTDVAESLYDSQQLNDILNSDKTPWAKGVYRIVIEANSVDYLKKYVAVLKDRFSQLDIAVNWSAGDQLALFLEQMPGDHVRESSFEQITNLAHIGTSGFNFGTAVGDRIKGRDF